MKLSINEKIIIAKALRRYEMWLSANEQVTGNRPTEEYINGITKLSEKINHSLNFEKYFTDRGKSIDDKGN